jgi:hypothetical protein
MNSGTKCCYLNVPSDGVSCSWAGGAAGMGRTEKHKRVCEGNLNKSLVKLRRKWQYNIKMHLKERGSVGSQNFVKPQCIYFS